MDNTSDGLPHRHQAKVTAAVQPDAGGAVMVMLKLECAACGGSWEIGPFPVVHLITMAKISEDLAKQLGVEAEMQSVVQQGPGEMKPADGLSLPEALRKHTAEHPFEKEAPEEKGWRKVRKVS